MLARAALQRLLDGNARFVAGEPRSRPNLERIRELSLGQSPFATVLACSDSRVPVETIFDHDPGDIFVVRIAGNFAADVAVASIEFGAQVLNSPLILVLGHTSCGAVGAAVEQVQKPGRLPGQMQMLVDPILPAARRTQEQADWWRAAVDENVRITVQRLQTESTIIAQALQRGHQIAGAVYNLSTGIVTLV